MSFFDSIKNLFMGKKNEEDSTEEKSQDLDRTSEDASSEPAKEQE